MKDSTALLIASVLMITFAIFFLIPIKLYEEKTRLEIQKLKYELSIYKENAESLK